jgi:hypothetical protein
MDILRSVQATTAREFPQWLSIAEFVDCLFVAQGDGCDVVLLDAAILA